MLPVEGLENAVFEKNGVKHISFEEAKLLGEIKFGRTHACYYQTKITSTIELRTKLLKNKRKLPKRNGSRE